MDGANVVPINGRFCQVFVLGIIEDVPANIAVPLVAVGALAGFAEALFAFGLGAGIDAGIHNFEHSIFLQFSWVASGHPLICAFIIADFLAFVKYF